MDKFPWQWVSRGRPLSGVLEENIYFEVHYAIVLLHNVNMNFVKCKVVCKMTATFWRPASREWATMGCSSAMRWLLANRRQWSASTPRWPGRPVLWETLVSHRHTSLWVVRARALGEPLEGHKQQQHQRKHSASTNTLNNERCSHLCDQRKMLRCCKTGSKVTHRVNHLGDQK